MAEWRTVTVTDRDTVHVTAGDGLTLRTVIAGGPKADDVEEVAASFVGRGVGVEVAEADIVLTDTDDGLQVDVPLTVSDTTALHPASVAKGQIRVEVGPTAAATVVTVALYVAGRVTGAPIDPAPPADPYLRRSDLEQHDQNPGAHDGVAGLAADALPRTGGGVVAGPVVASSSTTRGHLTARRGSAELHVTVQPGGVGAIYHGTNPVLRFLAGVLYSLWPVSLPAGEPGPSHAVRRDWVDGQLAGHDADADAHPPLQARIVALENAEVDLDGHNADPDAHPPLRAAIGAAQTSADDAHDLADAAVTQAGAAAQRADDAYELAGDADSAAQTAAGTATDAAATAQAAQWRADEAYDLADGLSGSLSAHDDDADAHAPLRGRLDALESVAVPDPAGVPDGYVLAVWGGQLVWAPPGEGGPGDAPPVN